MWLIAEYQPVTLFSLRSGIATASGAKTLFLPTPFAVRNALLDAAIRTNGLGNAELAFAWIKKLSIAVRPPEKIVITNLFAKVMKPTRKEVTEEAMDRTIAFREYAHLEGTIDLAFSLAEEQIPALAILLTQINYFGRRGCFFQLTKAPHQFSALPEGFFSLDGVYISESKVEGKVPDAFPVGVIQIMDDWGESLTFGKVNIYSKEKIGLGKNRVRKGIILPYRLIHSSKSFAYYERM
jgi:hypothetical protein